MRPPEPLATPLPVRQHRHRTEGRRSPGSVVARTYKQRLTDFFEREARAAGAPDPALLAQQLTIVFDGCGSRVVVTGQPLNGLALATATAMIAGAL